MGEGWLSSWAASTGPGSPGPSRPSRRTSPGGTTKGSRSISSARAPRARGALAFLDDRSILLGTEKAVAAAISRHAGARASANGAIADLLGRVKPGSTFWMVGDQALLENLPKTMPGGGASSPSITLPTLKSLVVNGDLDPVVALSVTGDAVDATAAKNLADIVRGFVGLAALQANQKPELAQLNSAVTVSTEASQVMVNARLPYELLDALAPGSRPHPHPQP